jgi:hypothetical protein
VLHFLIGAQSKILHYMAKHTGGQYFSAPPSGYAAALQAVLMQLHFRYELGFIPPAIESRADERSQRGTQTGSLKVSPGVHSRSRRARVGALIQDLKRGDVAVILQRSQKSGRTAEIQARVDAANPGSWHLRACHRFHTSCWLRFANFGERSERSAALHSPRKTAVCVAPLSE